MHANHLAMIVLITVTSHGDEANPLGGKAKQSPLSESQSPAKS